VDLPGSPRSCGSAKPTPSSRREDTLDRRLASQAAAEIWPNIARGIRVPFGAGGKTSTARSFRRPPPYGYQWRNIPKGLLEAPGRTRFEGNGYLAAYKTRLEPFQGTHGCLLSPLHTMLKPRYYFKIQNKLVNRGRAQPRAWCFRIKRPLSRAISLPSSRVAPPERHSDTPERVHTSNEDLAGDPLGWHRAKFRRPTDPLAHVDQPHMAVINPHESNRRGKLA
jgi:hypothetical protein